MDLGAGVVNAEDVLERIQTDNRAGARGLERSELDDGVGRLEGRDCLLAERSNVNAQGRGLSV